MEDFFKELSKHYLSIAAAILIALVVALFIKEPRITPSGVIFGVLVYFLFLLFATLLYKLSIKLKKKVGDINV